jgi:hypothetical protein
MMWKRFKELERLGDARRLSCQACATQSKALEICRLLVTALHMYLIWRKTSVAVLYRRAALLKCISIDYCSSSSLPSAWLLQTQVSALVPQWVLRSFSDTSSGTVQVPGSASQPSSSGPPQPQSSAPNASEAGPNARFQEASRAQQTKGASGGHPGGHWRAQRRDGGDGGSRASNGDGGGWNRTPPGAWRDAGPGYDRPSRLAKVEATFPIRITRVSPHALRTDIMSYLQGHVSSSEDVR